MYQYGSGDNVNPQYSQMGDDCSNDSFLNDKDNESSSTSFAGEKRFKQKVPIKPLDEYRLAECLTYLHKMISRKDKEDIFQLPVTDLIAPGYSTIIRNPMDLSTMKSKIDAHAYSSIMEYRVSPFSCLN